MKILFILPYSPIPTNTGNKNLTFNLLKYLNKKAKVDIIIIEDLGNKNKKFSNKLRKAYPNIKNIWTYERNKNLKLFFYKLFFLVQGLPPYMEIFIGLKYQIG